MSLHPLLELANDPEVRQAKGFKAKAAELTGESLETLYQAEVASAPRRHDAGKKYLGVRTGRIPTAPQPGKEDRHVALALGAWAKDSGAGIELPTGDKLEIVDSLVPLRSAVPDKSLGDADPNKRVEDIELLGLLPDDRLAVVCVKFLAAEATRGGAGDTPLRALLRGLAQAAMADANREALREEIQQACGRTIGEEAPALLIAATPRYWQICRKREAQKGAAWIRELERLAREIAEQIGVEVLFLALRLQGDPGWEYGEAGPVLVGTPEFDPSWEPGAGKLKPKPKSRPKKKADAAVEVVEPDLSKPPRAYSIFDSYASGERIEHPQLGVGVVQGVAGRGKISVQFGDDTKLLIHERPRA